jgi:uncharacterized Rmd1/YagE family protein
MKHCSAYCRAKTFAFGELRDYLLRQYRSAMYKGVLHIERDEGEAFIFPFGVLVIWGLSHDEIQKLLEEIRPFERETLEGQIIDEFSYVLSAGEPRIHEDCIKLATDTTLERLAVSYGIAQSVKLSEFEEYALHTVENTAHIPRTIAETGRLKLSRRAIAKMRGTLYLVESDINLNFDLLDTPEFFWEYPEVEHIYTLTVTYLDVKSRIEVLNKKVHVIHGLFEMLADEQKHKHSTVLEWIIIWLIAIEILFFMIPDILKLF